LTWRKKDEEALKKKQEEEEEYERKKEAGELSEPEVDEETGQTDLTGGGEHIFQKLDRTFAYRLLREAHTEVDDFSALTDANLEQLMRSINIDPEALKVEITPEQADFLINSAREASKLQTEITVDIETKKQHNIIIRAYKNAEMSNDIARRRLQISDKYSKSNNPYDPIRNRVQMMIDARWDPLMPNPNLYNSYYFLDENPAHFSQNFLMQECNKEQGITDTWWNEHLAIKNKLHELCSEKDWDVTFGWRWAQGYIMTPFVASLRCVNNATNRIKYSRSQISNV